MPFTRERGWGRTSLLWSPSLGRHAAVLGGRQWRSALLSARFGEKGNVSGDVMDTECISQ